MVQRVSTVAFEGIEVRPVDVQVGDIKGVLLNGGLGAVLALFGRRYLKDKD